MRIDEIDFNKAKMLLANWDYEGRLESFLRKNGIVHFLHKLQMDAKRERLERGEYNPFIDFYEAQREKFDLVLSVLEDEFSKKTFLAIIDCRMTYDIRKLEPFIVYPQYFLKDILKPNNVFECFVDGGAGAGDSVKDFLEYEESGKYMMYLWEADKYNALNLSLNIPDNVNYEIIPYVMWSKKCELLFDATGTDGSAIDERKGSLTDAESIDNVHAGKEITFIKMDIEGAEMDALIGAESTIKNLKPKLAISIYHKFEHLIDIPLWIKQIAPDYKLYIRHHSDVLTDSVLYATIG